VRRSRLVLERHDRIDVLVNNAGLVAGRRTLTEDGLELTMAVNHFARSAHELLLDRLQDPRGRVDHDASCAIAAA
jgi:NAD(P)-dependent dehydrogenase (short-subunit alcohol dehydrogenase family)